MAQKVIQDQPDIASQVGQSVTLNCQYEVSWYMISYSILWYKQLPSGQMTYLIRQYSENGNARDGRYSVNFQKADNSLSLTISALQLEDTAKFFCAEPRHLRPLHEPSRDSAPPPASVTP